MIEAADFVRVHVPSTPSTSKSCTFDSSSGSYLPISEVTPSCSLNSTPEKKYVTMVETSRHFSASHDHITLHKVPGQYEVEGLKKTPTSVSCPNNLHDMELRFPIVDRSRSAEDFSGNQAPSGVCFHPLHRMMPYDFHTTTETINSHYYTCSQCQKKKIIDKGCHTHRRKTSSASDLYNSFLVQCYRCAICQSDLCVDCLTRRIELEAGSTFFEGEGEGRYEFVSQHDPHPLVYHMADHVYQCSVCELYYKKKSWHCETCDIHICSLCRLKEGEESKKFHEQLVENIQGVFPSEISEVIASYVSLPLKQTPTPPSNLILYYDEFRSGTSRCLGMSYLFRENVSKILNLFLFLIPCLNILVRLGTSLASLIMGFHHPWKNSCTNDCMLLLWLQVFGVIGLVDFLFFNLFSLLLS